MPPPAFPHPSWNFPASNDVIGASAFLSGGLNRSVFLPWFFHRSCADEWIYSLLLLITFSCLFFNPPAQIIFVLLIIIIIIEDEEEEDDDDDEHPIKLHICLDIKSLIAITASLLLRLL